MRSWKKNDSWDNWESKSSSWSKADFQLFKAIERMLEIGVQDGFRVSGCSCVEKQGQQGLLTDGSA